MRLTERAPPPADAGRARDRRTADQLGRFYNFFVIAITSYKQNVTKKKDHQTAVLYRFCEIRNLKLMRIPRLFHQGKSGAN